MFTPNQVSKFIDETENENARLALLGYINQEPSKPLKTYIKKIDDINAANFSKSRENQRISIEKINARKNELFYRKADIVAKGERKENRRSEASSAARQRNSEID